MSLDDTSALYAGVKAWIAQQEAFEKVSQSPAPLTHAQRKALELLRAPLTITPPPEIGDVDYISLLNRYRQAHPGGEELVWDERESPTRAVGGAIGRICRVAITESRDHPEAPVESFPAAGYGFKGVDDPPVFARKKDAKKYAAKCAVEWLIAHNFMPSNLEDVAFPKGQLISRIDPSSFFRRPSSGNGDADDDADAGAPSPAQHPAPTKAAKGAKATPAVVDFNDDSLPATQRVAVLCHKLRLTAPAYFVERTIPGMDLYFDGRADFKHDNDSLPEGLGQVKRFEGQERTRQEVARLVLEHLLGMYRQREAMFEKLSAPPEGASLSQDD